MVRADDYTSYTIESLLIRVSNQGSFLCANNYYVFGHVKSTTGTFLAITINTNMFSSVSEQRYTFL